MTTGQCIKAARKKANMTQAELANKLGIPYQSISQWERDLRNPKYDTLKKIAEALDVFWLDLVGDDYIDYPGKDNPLFELDISFLNEPSVRESTQINHDNLNRINIALSKLNEKGQQIAVERVEELTKIPDYQRTEDSDDK